MEYYNNILCISGSELIPNIISASNYKKLAYTTGRINVVRRGCNSTPALVEYDSLPIKYRKQAEELYGDPKAAATGRSFASRIKADSAAITFYADFTYENGEYLKPKRQTQYCNEAAVFNTLREMIDESVAEQKKCGRRRPRIDWRMIAETIHEKAVTEQFPHGLPKNHLALHRKYDKYTKEGYAGLIHGGIGNDNTRKVSVHIERLLLSLYTMPNKPFAATVYDLYNLFINGKIQVFDKSTGELFDPAVFTKNGQPIELSEAAIWNYLNNPLNRIVVDEMRNDASYNLRVHRPFHRRKSPVYSFSKISMDDRDLTRKLHGGGRVKAYYAYDVTSGCVIGSAYSLNKDEALFLDCLRDTFRTIDRNGWGMPMEVEVEHHLVNKFFDDLALMFPYLRICNAGNSREKRAEHKNKEKKYGAEKRLGQPVGRWWARHEAYYQPQSKVNDEYVVPTGDYDRIVADDRAAIRKYNNELHPRQKKYPGMTRWEVLCYHINPDLPNLNKAMLYKHIGYSTKTSIRNSKEVTVQYAQYQLPAVDVMAKLQPNNLCVTAYYMPDADNIIDEVYLYQGDRFICTCQKIVPYNEATAERTEADERSLAEQSAYDAHYRKVVKEGKQALAKVDTITTEDAQQITEVQAVAAPDIPVDPDGWDIDELLAGFDPQAVRESAINNL